LRSGFNYEVIDLTSTRFKDYVLDKTYSNHFLLKIVHQFFQTYATARTKSSRTIVHNVALDVQKNILHNYIDNARIEQISYMLNRSIVKGGMDFSTYHRIVDPIFRNLDANVVGDNDFEMDAELEDSDSDDEVFDKKIKINIQSSYSLRKRTNETNDDSPTNKKQKTDAKSKFESSSSSSEEE